MAILKHITEDVTLRQTLDVFVIPEVENRKASGVINADFELYQFQILFHLTKKSPEIRFNEECRIVAEVDLIEKKNVNKGDPIKFDNVKRIKKIRLDDSDDGNCGHITYFMFGDQLISSFDFRYNKKIVGEHLLKANEFIETASFALDKNHYGAFIDNLYSAMELTAKANLLIHPDKEVLNSKTHKTIKTKIHRQSKLGNVSKDYSNLLQALSNLRDQARYMNGQPLQNDSMKYKDYLNTARSFIEHVKNGIK